LRAERIFSKLRLEHMPLTNRGITNDGGQEDYDIDFILGLMAGA
jgi:hypothetical protein